MSVNRLKTRQDDNESILFIGDIRENFKEKKLPNSREVLQVFFYQLRVLKKSVNESAWCTNRALNGQCDIDH